MNTIHKFPLEITDQQVVTMPKGAQILTVQVQNEMVCLWAVMDTVAAPEERKIEVFGTGNPIPKVNEWPQAGQGRKFIGTFQFLGGKFVGHVFERVYNPI